MSRPVDDIRRRLLTRSDLARLEVPASKVLSWLSRGAIDLVGNFTAPDGAGDPVFAVLADDVRAELAAGLSTSGRDRVVFAPLRARSLLLRALLAERGIAVPAEIDDVLVADPPALGLAAEAGLAQQLLAAGLEQVLVAAEDLEQEVAAVIELARREQTADPAPTAPAEGADETRQAPATVRCDGDVETPASAPIAQVPETEPIELAADAPVQARPPEHELDHPLLAAPSTDAPGLTITNAAGEDDHDDDGSAVWFDADELFGTTAEWDAETPAPQPDPESAGAPDRDSAATCSDSQGAPAAAPPVPETTIATTATSPADTMTEPRNDSAAITTAAPFQEAAVAVLDELFEGAAAVQPDAAGSVDPGRPDPFAETPAAAAITAPTVTAPVASSGADAHPEAAEAAEPATIATSVAGPGSPTDPPRQDGTSPATPTTSASTLADAAAENRDDETSSRTPPEPPPAIVNQVVVDLTPVERVISGLRGALEDLAHRPPPALDVQPIVTALDKSTERASSQDQSAKAASEALQAVAAELRAFGERIEKNGAATLQALAAIQAEHAADGHEPTPFVVARQSRAPFALLAIAFLLACWAAVFWFKTGSPKLALGTLVAGNLVGCCLLACRRD